MHATWKDFNFNWMFGVTLHFIIVWMILGCHVILKGGRGGRNHHDKGCDVGCSFALKQLR
jgi:hypothetical protein